MLNWIWLGLILISIVFAAFTGKMEAVSTASMNTAKSAVEYVIGLVGPMVFFLGLMRIAQDGGLLLAVARGLRPVMHRLFPDVPTEHPAMGAMIMNMASNMLGLGNAATPFGLKAMVELERINTRPGVATNAMALFLAINTSSITLFPLGVIAVRTSLGSTAPGSIFLPTLIATVCSTTIGVLSALLLSKLPRYRAENFPAAAPEATQTDDRNAAETTIDYGPTVAPAPMSAMHKLILVSFTILVLLGLTREIIERSATQSALEIMKAMSPHWLVPALIAALLLVGFAGRVRVYESMVEGGREGLQVAMKIVPFFVAILVAVGMFRASGAMEFLLAGLSPITSLIGVPVEALPVALLRPLSGGGSFALMSETMATYGPDSFIGVLVSTIQGSTETTFYVLALYFGAARVRHSRHTLPACLLADLAGFLGAVAACHLFFRALAG